MEEQKQQTEQPTTTIQRGIESIIFSTKWLLIPFYIGLIFTMLVYGYVYACEIVKMVLEAKEITHDQILLVTLELVDIVMIANLVKMIITGSYSTFVNKYHGREGQNVSSGMLKVKMSTSLIGVSSIHLLQSFINAKNIDMPVLTKQLYIHGMFLIGAFILILIEFYHEKAQQIEHNTKH